MWKAQSRQSAKLFLKSSELGLPQPLTSRRVCPLPPVIGGRGTLAGGTGVGRVPIPTRGHTLWYSLYIRTLWWKVKAFLLARDRNKMDSSFSKYNPYFSSIFEPRRIILYNALQKINC
jgi:hypothetical protein